MAILDTFIKFIVECLAKVPGLVSEHVKRNKTTYKNVVAGTAGTALVGGVYVVGEAVGHKKGKKEGTVEQAERDEKKFRDLNDKHEAERKMWNESDKKKNELIDDLGKNNQ